MTNHASDDLGRFNSELAAALQQANIVPLLVVGEADGLPYYAPRGELGREQAAAELTLARNAVPRAPRTPACEAHSRTTRSTGKRPGTRAGKTVFRRSRSAFTIRPNASRTTMPVSLKDRPQVGSRCRSRAEPIALHRPTPTWQPIRHRRAPRARQCKTRSAGRSRRRPRHTRGCSAQNRRCTSGRAAWPRSSTYWQRQRRPASSGPMGAPRRRTSYSDRSCSPMRGLSSRTRLSARHAHRRALFTTGMLVAVYLHGCQLSAFAS